MSSRTFVGPLGIAYVVVDVLCIIPIIVALGMYKSHLNYRESKDRMTRFGPWAFLAALLLALIYVLNIAEVSVVWSIDLYDPTTVINTLLALPTVSDLAGGLSFLFALVVMASFVQDWTDGQRRRFEDIVIRSIAWLLVLLTLVKFALNIAIDVAGVRLLYGHYYSAYDCPDRLTIAGHAVDLTYDCLAMLLLLGVTYLAIKNFASYSAGHAYRTLTIIALSFLIWIFALDLADNALWVIPRRIRHYSFSSGYTCLYPSVATSVYHAIEPFLFDAWYAATLIIFSCISVTGSKLGKSVDAIETYPQTYPEQQPAEHYAPVAAAPGSQQTVREV